MCQHERFQLVVVVVVVVVWQGRMDPPNKNLLGKILRDEITPVVMVVTTPLAEQACRKNGLTFVQLLSPLAHFHNIDIPVRTASDQPYRLQGFTLRMVYASDVRQQDPQVVVNHLKEVVSRASDEALFYLQSDPPKLEDLLSMSESEVLPSWFRTFNRDLSQAVSFSDHEAFDHPVACLIVVSSEDEQPMKKFVNPLSTDQLPSLLKEGAMDPNFLKHYLLLHDKQDGSIEKANGTLAEMRSTFGLSECRMLSINSNKDNAVEWEENPWAHCKIDSSSQDAACFLSISDLNEVKELMQDLSSKKIIPYMEQKIRVLNQQVAATRKGFKNQIKNLWWRKGKEDALDTPNGPVYTSSSTESQIRVLGDHAFMLRDYELALSNYRLLSTDYKLDKAWKHYAGVQEMMALSLFMLDQSRKDSEYCMETAFSTYLKMGSSGSKNATRCGLWWAEMLKARGQHKEAAGVLFRISQEEPSLHAAIMLEQASYCYLLCRPPMLRKFGFHLILAGNRYYNSDQRMHAIQAYRSALSVYKGNSWSYISDHVHFNIGRWYAFLEMFDAAVKHMLEILECTHQSLATQDLFLKDFHHVVENMGRKLEVAKLQLPTIYVSSLKVIFEDHRIYASSAAFHVRESMWQSLEENMVPSVTAVKSNWLESRKFHAPKKDDDGCVSLVGEAIRVFFEVKNPLQILLSVSGVSLVCELSTKPTTETDKPVSENECQNNVAHGQSSGTRDQNNDISSLELSEINFVLEGGEMREVQLDVTPKMEGFLKILGVKWILSGCVVGYHNFDVDLKKYKKGKGVQSSPRHNLAFMVVKGLPKLEGCIHHMPEKTYNGDFRPLMLELRNRSEYSVKNMKMKISHPRFLIPGNPGMLNLEFPGCLEKQANLEDKDMQMNIVETPGDLLFSFPTDSRIQGGSIFRWPLWLHTALTGNIFVYLSIYYEMEDYPCDMNFRTLRMYYELEVLPSLDVAIYITPCTSKMQEFLVRMEIASRAMSENVWLRQLSSVGQRWEISSLPAHAICPSQLLLAGQALLCFFKLKDHGEMSTESRLTFQGSDMQLGSQGDSEMVLDVSRTPLLDVHHHERSHQERFHQVLVLNVGFVSDFGPTKIGNVSDFGGNFGGITGSPTSVDFILISQLVGNDANPEQVPHIQLLSHHTCCHGIISKSPVWWLMDGPRTICHDFSAPFCEASFYITVHNCSDAVVSVKIATFDAITPVPGQSRDASPQLDSCAAGWYDVSVANNVKTVAVSNGPQFGKQAPESITPLMWCASSSTQIELQPTSTTEIPLRICLFSPGIYDLSNYEVHWSLQLDDATGFTKDVMWQSSGVKRGHPFFLTVLHSAP